MIEGGIVLARVAGYVDGAFAPIRFRKGASAIWANAWFLRSDLLSGAGAAVPLGGGDAAHRQQQSRVIGDLVKARALRQISRGRLMLTPAGDARARRDLGMPGAAASLDLVAELRAWPTGTWADEPTLADALTLTGTAYRSAVAALHERGAVALAAGWLETRSTTTGRMGWRVSAAGRRLNLQAARKSASAAAREAEDMEQADVDSATEAWLSGFEAARHWLETYTNANDIGPIPLTSGDLCFDRPQSQPQASNKRRNKR